MPSITQRFVSLCLLSSWVFLAPAMSHAGVEPIMSTNTAWDGSRFEYPDGEAKVTAIKLVLNEGDVSPYHCHPVPTMGYVIKGKIEVETADGKTTVMEAGQPAVEVMGKIHRGRAIEAPVEIVVFYAGNSELPTTLLPDSELGKKYCH